VDRLHLLLLLGWLAVALLGLLLGVLLLCRQTSLLNLLSLQNQRREKVLDNRLRTLLLLLLHLKLLRLMYQRTGRRCYGQDHACLQERGNLQAMLHSPV
jgi:hypothetical protein